MQLLFSYEINKEKRQVRRLPLQVCSTHTYDMCYEYDNDANIITLWPPDWNVYYSDIHMAWDTFVSICQPMNKYCQHFTKIKYNVKLYTQCEVVVHTDCVWNSSIVLIQNSWTTFVLTQNESQVYSIRGMYERAVLYDAGFKTSNTTCSNLIDLPV